MAEKETPSLFQCQVGRPSLWTLNLPYSPSLTQPQWTKRQHCC